MKQSQHSPPDRKRASGHGVGIMEIKNQVANLCCIHDPKSRTEWHHLLFGSRDLFFFGVCVCVCCCFVVLFFFPGDPPNKKRHLDAAAPLLEGIQFEC